MLALFLLTVPRLMFDLGVSPGPRSVCFCVVSLAATCPNRPDTNDRYWGVCYILLRRRRVQFPSNRYLQGCSDRLNGRPPSMS